MSDSPTQKTTSERKYCPKCYRQFDGPELQCPDDETQLRAGNDPLIGKVFADRYEIQSVLGLGGMSIVYRAQHRLMNRTVAIKMLHKLLKDDVVALERFKLESQAASSLSHQNIITVYDFGVTPEGEPFFVMDCLEGESLEELIERKRRIDYQRALPIFKQIADGLDAAHKKGIIHRDLKPGNVILLKQEDGTELVKLVDFGIAKLMPQAGRHQQNLTQTGEVFGSPIYMSPEQCQGKELTPRTDIYALGCVMYETLSGMVPFIGDNFLEIMNLHVGGTAKPLHEIAPEAKIPALLEDFIFSCIAKNPDERPQSAAAASATLSQITYALLGSSGRHPGTISGMKAATGPHKKKSHLPTIVSTISIAILIAGSAFIFLWPGPPEDQGTVFEKVMWQIDMAIASNTLKNNDFSGAETQLLSAEALTNKFSDSKSKLMATLKQKCDLYYKWEGHAEDLERTKEEISAIQVEHLKKDLHHQMQVLDELNQPTDSNVRQTNMKLRTQAELPGIVSTASQLYGRGMYLEEQRLLTRSLATVTKMFGTDSAANAQIETKLVECLLAQRKYDQVRPLLAHACQVRKDRMHENPAAYVRVLNQLGQFDLDQSDFANAETELTEALERAHKLKGHKELLLMCIRSKSNFFQQTGHKVESQKLLQEAAILDQNSAGLQ